MTKEEAIKNLLEMRDGMPFDKCQDWIEAISVAIEALSKRDNAEPIPQWRGCMDECLPYCDGKEV